jgi:hypothetical protein
MATMPENRVSRKESTRYRTIVADPPWDLKAGPEFGSNGPTRDLVYPTMTVDEIKALPVRDMSDNLDDDAHLYLWTVNAYPSRSVRVRTSSCSPDATGWAGTRGVINPSSTWRWRHDRSRASKA